jgi:hypothetical protein
MEAISYVNIFETKGLEYLLVISFLLGFLVLVRILAPRDEAVDESVTTKPRAAAADHPVTCVADFECPYRASITGNLDDGVSTHKENVVA